MQTETDVPIVLARFTLPPSYWESSRATAFPVRQEGQPALVTQFEALWYQYFYSPCLDRFLMFPDQLKWDGEGLLRDSSGVYLRSVLRILVLVWVLKQSVDGWRNGSEVKHTWCSYRGQEPRTWHPRGGFQLSVTPVPECCSALFWCAYLQGKYPYT